MARKKKETPEFKAYARRRWLNAASEGGTAFINASIEEISKERTHAYVSGTIDIADCSRIVSLEFYDDDGELTHAMKKLDTLMIALGEFRGKLQDAAEAMKRSKAAGEAKDAREAKEKK